MKMKSLLRVLAVVAAVFALFALEPALADVKDGVTLTTITNHVNTTVSEMLRILTDIALVAGVAFVLASFFKFHQHKLNPTQVPISQGVTLLLIGAALMLFVVMLPTAKKAIFGSAEMSQIGGSQMATVFGSADSSGK